MTASQDKPPSFDPRTWGGERPASPQQGPDPPKPTFDPRTWAESGAAQAAATTPAPALRLDVRRASAAATITLLLGGGAISAHWSATHRTAAPPASSLTAPQPAGQMKRSVALASPNDVAGALTGAGVAPDQANQAAAAAAAMASGGGEVHTTFYLDPAGSGVRLVRLELRHEDGSGALVQRAGAGFAGSPLKADVRVQVKDVRGEMDANEFYSSAVAAGVPDSLIHDFAQAFAFDFDFQREVKAGDIFEVVFSQGLGQSGEALREPELLFVLLTTQAKSVALYRFAPPGQAPGWFDGNGRSIIRAFMRTPVQAARISSTFGMREHPVLGFMKLHKGVDFAAPIGTPIYAAGDGVVQHAEFKELNGNWVEILHDNGWQTIYLHLSAFGSGVKPGARVRQGQEIGQVGTTGRSTGPHLHYEMHINNEPVDPMSVPLQSGPVLSGQVMQAYIKERNRIDAKRAQQSG